MSRSSCIELELIHVIVQFGMGSRVLHSAKRHGIPGGTVTLGRGTMRGRALEFLGLTDVRKEIVMLMADKDTAYQAMVKLDQEFVFKKPNHGIMFTTTVCSLAGTHLAEGSAVSAEREEADRMYHAITIIVEKGKAEQVVDAAVKAGSKGGTILNARGSGVHETSRLFSMDIEPEREVVLILSEREKTDAIVASVREELKLDEPGNGMLYVQDINKTYGIHR